MRAIPLLYTCVGSAAGCLGLTQPLWQRMLLVQGEEPHHTRGGRSSQRCVCEGCLQSPHVPCQAESSYLRHKTPPKIKIAVLLSAWHREGGSCAKHHNFCPWCFMHEGGLTPARGVSAISVVSDGSWLCSLSPWSRAGLALPWQPGGALARRVAKRSL